MDGEVVIFRAASSSSIVSEVAEEAALVRLPKMIH
jgi:hypothetical protein